MGYIFALYSKHTKQFRSPYQKSKANDERSIQNLKTGLKNIFELLRWILPSEGFEKETILRVYFDDYVDDPPLLPVIICVMNGS